MIHDIPNEDKGEQSEEDESNSEGEDNLQIKTTMGEWYRGQVSYGIKSMASEGSTAWRGVTELGNTLKDYHDTIPERVYIFADGGGDRRIAYLQVQMGLIAMFLCYDLDEQISARPAAGCSYRNPIERCHAIANLGFQSVGLMRQSMNPETERIIKNLNSTADIRKAFTMHKDLEKN